LYDVGDKVVLTEKQAAKLPGGTVEAIGAPTPAAAS
jgi:hypothetical protein